MKEIRNQLNSVKQTEALLRRLRESLRGEVLGNPADRGIYATDASIYQMEPVGIVCPQDREDLAAAMEVCRAFNCPVVSRGGGTSLTGQSVGHGVIIDFTRHMHRILEINPEERWVRVEPGLVRDELNNALEKFGLHFAPDPATSNRATVGGMISANAAGMRSAVYGMTRDHVLELELLLSSGEILKFSSMDEAAYDHACRESHQEADVLKAFKSLILENRDEIRSRFPKVTRRSGGYSLDAFTNGFPWNLSKLIAASEGTLGMILEAKLNLEPLPRHKGLCLVHYNDMGACLRGIQPIAELDVSAVELLDGLILKQARKHPLTKGTCTVVEAEPEAILIVEVMGEASEDIENKLARVRQELSRQPAVYACPMMLEPEDMEAVWLMRSSALGLMSTVRDRRKPVPYIEDAAVPLANLPNYIEEVLELCRNYDQPVSLFAHAGVGLLHIRPMHDLHDPSDAQQLTRIQQEVFSLVQKYRGSWSGEHGDGIVRGGFNRAFFGEQVYEVFRQVKILFDPLNLMNPGKIVETPPVLDNLRAGSDIASTEHQSVFRFQTEGGLLTAVEQCNGVGACRKMHSGVMCPSFMATRDERHSTRGRANALRLALTGQLKQAGGSDRELFDIFDLCLSCRACRTECPNQVDVSKMKAEVFHKHHCKHGTNVGDRVMADPARLGLLASGRFSGVFNLLLHSRPGASMLEGMLGVDRRRKIPAFTNQRFSNWFKTRSKAQGGQRKVTLFVDTWMEFHEPEVGQAAVAVLEHLGFDVDAAWLGDSQRAAISKGFLDKARTEGSLLVQGLEEHSAGSDAIVFCEPSCFTSVAEDLPDLLAEESPADAVAEKCRMIDQVLMEQLKDRRAEDLFGSAGNPLPVLLHGHCHQKASGLHKITLSLLDSIPGIMVTDSQAGCCGMAGSFGYEKRHYELSRAIAEERLLPAIEAFDPVGLVAASGFSCRHQVRDLTGRKAVHPIEIICKSLS